MSFTRANKSLKMSPRFSVWGHASCLSAEFQQPASHPVAPTLTVIYHSC